MTKKILIDARQPLETRVATINQNVIEDFEYEINQKKFVRGNIYLARVTRVEPSLQAAFVEYGGNKQGFLAFSEIHPDYYRIPVEDRQKILENAENKIEQSEIIEVKEEIENTNNQEVEEITNDEVKKTKINLYKNYKIQEVISKRQILLVQVVKEERGNKGAALTSYLSIAGRYCVLMPNTPRSGGVSRKIINYTDRQRLKKVVEGLRLPKGIGVIIRTAGSKRTKVEIKRDYQNLLSIWEEIKTKTLESSAPDLIYEEGSIVKRCVRDMYNNDIEEILVEGKNAFKACKDYMKSLMPSHTKKVQAYVDSEMPLFQKYKIDSQLSDIFKPTVILKSGGYLVINHTEALVAVDVNSGKATKQRSIESTALQTNIEAAEEFAKQAKLRDLSGLIVIDFIDMEDYKNKNAVERKLRDSLKNDRARIQIGDISNFGLLELSRQRLRPSVSEISSVLCENCGGVGRIQSIELSAMQILRAAEEELISGKIEEIRIKLHPNITIHILNQKLQQVKDIEDRQNGKIIFENDNNLIPPNFVIETLKEKSSEANQDFELNKTNQNKQENKRKIVKNSKTKAKNNIISIASLLNEKEQAHNEAKEVDTSKQKKKIRKKGTTKEKTKIISKSKVEFEERSKETNEKKSQLDKKSELNNKKKNASKKRKKMSSSKIDVVRIDNKDKKSTPKKTGWWSN